MASTTVHRHYAYQEELNTPERGTGEGHHTA